jgi:hypothetical protein
MKKPEISWHCPFKAGRGLGERVGEMNPFSEIKLQYDGN